MTARRLTHAINDALIEEMERDPRVIVIGEDVDVGVFGDTKGLQERFGPVRVRNTPISEATLTGMAVGAAAAGYRVVLHMMFSNFIYTGFDGIANQAAKLRQLTGGQIALPLTILVSYGGGRSMAGQHSDAPYPVVMNLGGVNVLVPATAADAKGLLKTALRGSDPSIFFEPGGRGGETSEVPDGEYVVPLGKAAIAREGTDLTIVAVGTMLRLALRAAEMLAEGGIAAEVLDPRTLVPLDEAAIEASVRKTHRLVVVDEARDRCSAASHIAAVAADRAFDALAAPIKRVTVADVSLPYSPPLEKHLLPSSERIVDVARGLLAGARA
jgi:pyruvate dehydrogenase E1 component beta subunit